MTTANKTNVNEIKADTNFEEANALNYANALKNLSKALELEAKTQKNKVKTGLSLFEKLQNQIKVPELPFENLPEAWKFEQNLGEDDEVVTQEPEVAKKKKNKKQKAKLKTNSV